MRVAVPLNVYNHICVQIETDIEGHEVNVRLRLSMARKTYLEPLVNLLHEHVTVRCEAIYGEHCLVGTGVEQSPRYVSAYPVSQYHTSGHRGSTKDAKADMHSQMEDFGRVMGLDFVSLRLTHASSNGGEVRPAMARMVPPFSDYRLKLTVWAVQCLSAAWSWLSQT